MRLGGRENEARREGVWGLCTIGVTGLLAVSSFYFQAYTIQ